MSFVENITRRERPTRANAASSLRTALAAPLPAAVAPSVARVKLALAGLEAAGEAHSQASGAETRIEAETAHRAAQSALSRAVARQEVAARLGEDDAPTDAEIDEMQAAVDATAAVLDSFAPRVQAFAEEVERRKAVLADANAALAEALAPWRDAAEAAAHAQLQAAADMAAESKRVATILRNNFGTARVTFPGIARGEADIVAENSTDLPKDAAEAVATLWNGQRRE